MQYISKDNSLGQMLFVSGSAEVTKSRHRVDIACAFAAMVDVTAFNAACCQRQDALISLMNCLACPTIATNLLRRHRLSRRFRQSSAALSIG